MAEELPPHFSPFACRGKHRRLRFSYLSSVSALPLEVKWLKAPVAEELPPRFSPFACRASDRRLRFSYYRIVFRAVAQGITWSNI